jgi:hypothetical protein
MRSPEQQQGQKLVWQRPEDLLQPEHLASILANACRSGGRALFPELAPFPRSSTLRVLDVQRATFEGGVSGARLERIQVQVETQNGRHPPLRAIVPLICKRMAPAESWLMRTSGDTRCREVQLWRSGLLDALPPTLLVPILAAAYDEHSHEGALLMADVGRWLGSFESCFLPVPPKQQALHLDHLARLHARFWNDARLGDATLGLASLERALLLLSPAAIAAQRAAGNAHPYLAAAASGWQAFFDHGLPEPLRRIQQVLDHPDSFLASAARAPATLVHGDVWPPNLGLWRSQQSSAGRSASNRTILIDWALATAGPATFDLFWLLFYWQKVERYGALQRYRTRLQGHLARKGILLNTPEWNVLVDLAVVRTVLTCGETLGQAIIHAPDEASRAQALFSLRWWALWADQAIERRGWNQ